MTLHRTNWHEAAVCAIQIDLRDYAHMLEYHPEYTLSNNKNRIDLLVIRKLLDQPILKSIGRLFKSYNLFEIKGICSCLLLQNQRTRKLPDQCRRHPQPVFPAGCHPYVLKLPLSEEAVFPSSKGL